MNRFSRLSLPYITLALVAAIVTPVATRAESMPSLIKGSSATVYALTANQERYAFPSLSVFSSWYADTRGITRVDDAELAAFPLRGEVSYRPGSFLLKTPADARVYAITQKHVLRWIASEAIAKELYGEAWATQVVDVPADYLGQFALGNPIETSTDYSPITERMHATLLDDGFITTVAAVPPSTPNVPANDAPPSSEVPEEATIAPPSLDELISAIPTSSDKIATQFANDRVSAGSRVSFQSTVFAPITIEKHVVYAIAPGVLQPILWKNCEKQSFCGSSNPFWRKTILYSQFVSEGVTYTSRPVTLDVVGGEPPRPTLSLGARPATNEQEILLEIPKDETARLTAVVEGTSIDSPVLGLCSTDCSFTVEIKGATSITAFTWLGGVYEPSNTLQLKPE